MIDKKNCLVYTEFGKIDKEKAKRIMDKKYTLTVHRIVNPNEQISK